MANNSLEIEISAKTDKATNSLNKLVSQLDQVNSRLNSMNTNNIQNIVNAMNNLKGGNFNFGGSGSGGSSNATRNANNISTALMQLTNASNKANRGFKSLNSTMFKLASSFGMFYAAAYPFIRLFQKIWKSSEKAMDYVETFNYFNVTMNKLGETMVDDMGDAGTESAEAYARHFTDRLAELNAKMTGFDLGLKGELYETYSKNLGLDIEALMNFQAQIGSVTNSMKMNAKASTYAQKALSMLAGDLSSLKNIDLDTVMTNLQSGLIGQSRALYKYGIDITNATLKQYALENGITKSVSAMTQSEKAQLRLLAILDQSRVAWGDLGTTVNTSANQLRMFTQQASNLARVLGNLFLPIIEKVLPYLNAVLIVLRQIFTMLGVKLYGDGWLTDLNNGVSSGNFGNDLGDIADGLDDVGDAADEASGKAKKLKQNLLGIDELNIISEDTSSGSSSVGGGGFDLSDQIGDMLMDYESIWDKIFDDLLNRAVQLANRIMAYIKGLNFKGLGKWLSDALANSLNSINWKRIFEGATNLGKYVGDFINGLIQPSTFAAIGRTFANLWNTAIKFGLELARTLNFEQIGQAIAAYWNAIFTTFNFAEFGEMIGRWVGGIVKTISTAIKNIKWDKLFDGIKEGIQGFFKGLFESGVSLGDIAIVLGALTIRKISKLAWGSMVTKLIIKSLGTKLAVDLGTDITFSNLIATGLQNAFSNVKVKWDLAKFITVDTLGQDPTLHNYLKNMIGDVGTILLGIGTTLAGVTLAVHEFTDMWEDGWDIISEILKDLGIALATVGAVILGAPVGLAVLLGGITAVGTSVLILAHDQLPKLEDSVVRAFSNPGGVPISEVCKTLAENIAQVGDKFIELNNKAESLTTARSSIENVAESIELIKYHMDSGVISTEEGVEKLKSAFADLESSIDTYFSDIEMTLLAAFGSNGALAIAFQEMGIETEAVMQTIVESTDEGKLHAQELMDKMSDPNISTEQFIAYANELYGLIGVEDTLTQTTEEFADYLNSVNIDYESLLDSDGEYDSTIVVAALGEIIDNAQLTQEQIALGVDNTKKTLDDLDKSITDPTRKQAIEEYTNALPDAMEKMQGNVRTQSLQVADTVQTEFVNNITQIISDAEAEWEEMNWWERLLTGANSADQYARNNALQYKQEYIDPLSADIESQFEELGIEGAAWASDAASGIIQGLFETDIQANTTKLNQNYKAIIEGGLKDLKGEAEKYGEDTIAGFNNAIHDKSDTTKSFVDEWENGILDFIHDGALRFGSPSETTYEFGQWTIEGFNNAISENMESTKTILDQWVNMIMSSFDEIASSMGGMGSMGSIEGQGGASGQSMYTIGTTLVEQFNKGIQDTYKTSEPIILEWQKMIVDNFDLAWSSSFKNMKEVWDKCVPYFEVEVLAKLIFDIQTFSDTMSDIINATYQSMLRDSADTCNQIISIFEQGFNNIIDALESFVEEFNILLEEISAIAEVEYPPLTTPNHIGVARVSAYATGGFPTAGELFIANERGAELVGSMNGRTTVANQQEITEGIAMGVRSAVQEALVPYLNSLVESNNEIAEKDFSVNIGDREIARANQRGMKSLGHMIRS